MIKTLLTKRVDTASMVDSAPTQIFKSAHLAYISDAQRADAMIVPLGVIVEVNFLHLRGYGLLARKKLDHIDPNTVGVFTRKQLAQPFPYFRDRIHQIFKLMEDDISMRGRLIETMDSGLSSIATLNVNNHLIDTAWKSGQGEAIWNDVSAAIKLRATYEFKALLQRLGDDKAEGFQNVKEEYDYAEAA